MKTAEHGEGDGLLVCVTIGPYYCKQDVVDAVIDYHSVDKIAFQGPEEHYGDSIDHHDEQDGGDQVEQDGQVRGLVYYCHGTV